MGRLVIKRSDAKSEYGGVKPWLHDKLDLPAEVDISIKDGGMYGNRYVIFEFPNGKEVKCRAYFSSGISPHYKVSVRTQKRERLRELVEQMEV